ncbi:MAG: GGDEF domain-containing protein [Proteobacteria bacterium]|nr:GGDEF domain-containing protein [Pseudomonadota bacterium]
MHSSFLIVSQHMNFASFQSEFSNLFEITIVENAQDALAALALPITWKALLVAAQLPDMSGLELIGQAASVSSAVPLLLAPDARLAELVSLANKRSVFRVVPETAPADTLAVTLLDAARQFDLLQQERLLLARIEQLTLTDPLTGCCTRPLVSARLHRELRRSLRYRHPLSIILCDFDGLAKINETFGHTIGDAVLSGFAKAASQAIRQDIDTIARWGGDEFLVLLPETPVSGADIVASRLRERCAQLSYTVNDQVLKCSATFGVTGFVPEQAENSVVAGDLLLRAEHCLQQAKSAGGNLILSCP